MDGIARRLDDGGAFTAPPAATPMNGETVGWIEARPSLWASRLTLCLATEGVIGTESQKRIRLALRDCDLSLLNSGRAPLLLNHIFHIDHLVGVIERAWIDGGKLFASARLSSLPRVAEVRRLVRERTLRNCSMGFLSQRDIEPGADGVLRVHWWRPHEVSLCAVPRGWLDMPAELA